MNPTLRPLFARRSVRSFLPDPVADELLTDLLEAAMAAPSAAAKDPWHFVVLGDAGLRARLAQGLPNGKFLATAPTGIAVCGDIERAHARELSYLLQDCSAAIENILLAAAMLGLGACWLGVHPREDRVRFVAEALELPANVIPVSLIAIGWPAAKAEARTRYRREAVHHDTWQA